MEYLIITIGILLLYRLLKPKTDRHSVNASQAHQPEQYHSAQHSVEKKDNTDTINLSRSIPVTPYDKPGHQETTLTSSVSLIKITLGTRNRSSVPSDKTTKQIHADQLWVTLDRKIQIKGYEISGGMIYVGQGLKTVSDASNQLEPAMINPNLPINASNPDRSGTSLSYWPSFHDITPEARAAFLEWLAGGRIDPNISIGYVFIYFYGLERRLLADIHTSPKAKDDVLPILQELERLLSIYQHNKSFRNYAENLLDFIRIRNNIKPQDNVMPNLVVKNNFSLMLKYKLASLALQEAPIPFELAFEWWRDHPNTRIKTPVKRCPDEMIALFKIRYRSRFGSGMIVKPNKTPLTMAYHPASASFWGQNYIIENVNLPDLTVLKVPVNTLTSLANDCMESLDAFSRYLGRNPNGGATLPALALLPPEILYKKRDILQPLLDFLPLQLGRKQFHIMNTSELLQFWPLIDKNSISKAEAVGLVQLLATLGAGIEPDIRFGNIKLNPNGRLCLFRLSDPKMETPTTDFLNAAVLIQLLAVIAHADGVINPAEAKKMTHYLASIPNLTDAERERLMARIQWFLAEPIGLGGIQKQLAHISNDQRHMMSEFLIAMTCADGRVHPSEIKTLETIYKLLGLDPQTIHDDLHRMQTHSSDQLTTIQIGHGPTPPIYSIPAQSDQKKHATNTIVLDASLIAEKRKNTEQVKMILADIFTPEAEQPSTVTIHSNDADTLIDGMDAAHSRLFFSLLTTTHWTRPDFNQLCETLGLMPDGAMEMINESAYEKFEEPLLEENEDDRLTFNQKLAQEMLA